MAREQTHSTHKGKGATAQSSTQHSEKGKEGGKEGKEGGKEGKEGGNEKAGKAGAARTPAQVQKHLAGLDYPVNKQRLIEKAREEGAEHEVLALLERLPEREYDSPVGVSREIGKLMGHS